MTVIGANGIPSSSTCNRLNVYDMQTEVALDDPEALKEFDPNAKSDLQLPSPESQRLGNTNSLKAEKALQPVNQEASKASVTKHS